MAELRHAGVLLQRQVRAALVKRDVFANEVGLGKACLHVAEFVDLSPMDIAVFAVIMDTRLGRVERRLDRGDRREKFILDVNQIQRFGGHVLIHCGDGGHRVSHHADLANRQGMFIFADGQSPVGNRQVLSDEHRS